VKKSTRGRRRGKPGSDDEQSEPLSVGVDPEAVRTPDLVLRGQRDIVIDANACEQVEEWTYTPGSGQSVALLPFQNGALKNIRHAGRIR
jgi:hypothetical protein